MNNETKQDVFEELLDSYMYSEDIVIDEISTDGVADRLNLGNIIASTRDRYAEALPDDMPVIPKAVGDVIVKLKHKRFSLSGAMSYAAVVSLTSWMTFEHEEDFARAWVIGVWRVDETGEIVKLEAEDLWQ